MADSGSTQSASQAQSGLNEANEASQSESEKAAVQRMHQATQAEAEARRQLEEAYQENHRLRPQHVTTILKIERDVSRKVPNMTSTSCRNIGD